jgi:hypothetical protein
MMLSIRLKVKNLKKRWISPKALILIEGWCSKG